MTKATDPFYGDNVAVVLKTGFTKSGKFLEWDEYNVNIEGEVGDDIGKVIVIPWSNIDYIKVNKPAPKPKLGSIDELDDAIQREEG